MNEYHVYRKVEELVGEHQSTQGVVIVGFTKQDTGHYAISFAKGEATPIKALKNVLDVVSNTFKVVGISLTEDSLSVRINPILTEGRLLIGTKLKELQSAVELTDDEHSIVDNNIKEFKASDLPEWLKHVNKQEMDFIATTEQESVPTVKTNHEGFTVINLGGTEVVLPIHPSVLEAEIHVGCNCNHKK